MVQWQALDIDFRLMHNHVVSMRKTTSSRHISNKTRVFKNKGPTRKVMKFLLTCGLRITSGACLSEKNKQHIYKGINYDVQAQNIQLSNI
jgi:hypothetical protein